MLRLLASAALLGAVATAALAGPAEKPEKPSNGEKLVCKRFVETGSLVKGTKTCKTKREWDRERANIRESFTGGGSCASGQTGNCN
jgi:hypothetical protein